MRGPLILLGVLFGGALLMQSARYYRGVQISVTHVYDSDTDTWTWEYSLSDGLGSQGGFSTKADAKQAAKMAVDRALG